MFVCLHYIEIAEFRSLPTRSLPWLCFCDHACKTVLREYVVVKLGPLYYYLTSLPRLLD